MTQEIQRTAGAAELVAPGYGARLCREPADHDLFLARACRGLAHVITVGTVQAAGEVGTG